MSHSIAARTSARTASAFLSRAIARTARSIGLVGLGLAALAPLQAQAAGSVVISQIYGGAGCGTAGCSTYKNDYIELFNRSNSPVDITGWSVQYASAAGSTSAWSVTTLPSRSIPAGGYLLVAESSNANGTNPLPTPDVTGSISMSATAGRVALLTTTTATTPSTTCPSGATLVDLVAFGTGTACGEGTAAPAPSTTTADFRAANGCTDTDSNSADFSTATPAARNSATALNVCGGSPPTGTGAASPTTVNVGNSILFTVATAQGTPASAITGVTIDLSSVGGSATQALFDNGSNGDTTSGDGTYSYSYTIPSGVSGGAQTVNATVTDALSRNSAAVPISFTIDAPTAITATGVANPATASAGGTTLLTVTVTPGSNPTSSGVSVTADLSSIGGSSTQAFFDNATNGDVTAGDNVFSFNATVGASVASGSYTLPVSVSDAQSRTATASIAVTVAPTYTIMQIQGTGGRSPYAGSGTTLGALLSTPSAGRINVVTAVKVNGSSSGFFMQDFAGDGDPVTSDGIFVFTGAAPSVAIGDVVSVSGKVQEFSGSSEIAGTPTVTVLSHGHALPPAYDLTTNLPSTNPNQGICMGTGSTINVSTDGYQASNFACLDGMLVRMSNGVVVAPTSGSGGSGIKADSVQFFYATAGNPRPFREPGLAPGDANIATHANVPTFDGDPEIVEIYYPGLKLDATTLPNAGIYNAGQHFDLTGIVQGFQPTGGALTYEMYPRVASDIVLQGTAPTYPIAVASSVAGKLTIGSQNMLHFFNSTPDGADTTAYNDTCAATGAADTCPTAAQYQARLQKMSLQIRTVLKAPLVQVAQEVENLSVATDLANQIHADDPTLTYHPYEIQGNDPGGINIAFLVRDGVTVHSVSQFAKSTQTNACSGGGTCTLNDRPPFLLDASYNGYDFRVLAIYDRSLINLGVNDYVGLKRRQEAEQVARIVQALQTNGAILSGAGATISSTDACNAQFDHTGTFNATSCPDTIAGNASIPFVVVGDFNAYEFSDGYVDVTGTIMGTVDTDPTHSVYPPTTTADTYNPVYVAPTPHLVNSTTPLGNPSTSPDTWNDNYSYTFNGYAQEIDHILMSSVANSDFVQLSHAHGNADVSSSSSDVTSSATARRTSDHDGQVITLGYVVKAVAGTNGSVDNTSQTVGYNGTTTFAFTPASGYHVDVVSDGCAGIGSGSTDPATHVYTYTTGNINADCTVSVTFSNTTTSYTLTYLTDGNGTISGTTPQTVAAGGNGTAVTAVPNAHYHFFQWDDGSVANPRTDSNVQADITATAQFAIDTVAVLAQVNGGTVAPPSGEIPYGSNTSFTFAPNSGFVFDSSSDNCNASGTFNSTTGVYSLTNVTQACTVTVNYVAQTFTVTATIDANSTGHGAITTATSVQVSNGGTAQFTIEPHAGYNTSVLGDTCTAAQTSGTTTWTTSAITQACHLTVTFTPDYFPLNPARLMDTRTGATTVDGQAAGGGALAPGETRVLPVINRGGLPNTAFDAVVMNVTAVTPTGPGYLTVWSGDGTVPNAGNLNYSIGRTLSTLVVAKANVSGDVSIYNGGTNAVDVTASVLGYFPLNSTFQPTTPQRFMDTRQGGTTIDGTNAPAPGANSQIDLPVAGRGPLPATGVGAVLFGVTGVAPTTPGFITVWPTGDTLPAAGNLNLNTGVTLSNPTFAKIGTGGDVSFYNGSSSTVNLVANLQGWFPVQSGYTPIVPQRFLDTRASGSTIDGQSLGAGALQPNATLTVKIAGRGNVPATGVTAVAVNLVAVNSTSGGYLTLWPAPETQPTVGSISLNKGLTLPNLVISKLDADGNLKVFSGALAPTDVVINVQGWFAGDN